MSIKPGGGTRLVNHGATSTRRALSTNAVAAPAATHPENAARNGKASVTTTASPATWATPIIGTATRFSGTPALVTRENVCADTGNNAISAATEAASEATS